MPEHFTNNTVSAAFFCTKCNGFTQHRIDGHRKGPCLECIAKLDAQHQPAAQTFPQSRGLFDPKPTLPLDIELWPDLWHERFEERAAMLQYDANFSKTQAEILAERDIRKQASQEWEPLT